MQYPSPSDIAKAEGELHEEHRDIHRLARELRTVKNAAELDAKLSTLHEMLRKHFAHEEYPGGLYDQVGACSGQFAERVRKLADEHYQVLSSLLSLRNRLREEGEDGLSDVIQEVDGLVLVVKGHESREHRLVDEARRETQ